MSLLGDTCGPGHGLQGTVNKPVDALKYMEHQDIKGDQVRAISRAASILLKNLSAVP